MNVAVEFLKKGCSDVKVMMLMFDIVAVMMLMFDPLQSLTLLSPVDGLDPFGLVPIYCITPGEMLNFR